MPPLTLDPVVGISSVRFLSYWNGDGIYYDSVCIVTADGVATLTLHVKKAKK
ncbi:hypothetical protein [Hymenobacter aquaticus]|uniref:hypothetical protein n=1 Tax=Hymenobacter aquaticus TaxID=1867101 RepID=UPI00143670A1|nr:hypothetical protein [Hymenobacter aquaticus]